MVAMCLFRCSARPCFPCPAQRRPRVSAWRPQNLPRGGTSLGGTQQRGLTSSVAGVVKNAAKPLQNLRNPISPQNLRRNLHLCKTCSCSCARSSPAATPAKEMLTLSQNSRNLLQNFQHAQKPQEHPLGNSCDCISCASTCKTCASHAKLTSNPAIDPPVLILL